MQQENKTINNNLTITSKIFKWDDYHYKQLVVQFYALQATSNHQYLIKVLNLPTIAWIVREEALRKGDMININLNNCTLLAPSNKKWEKNCKAVIVIKNDDCIKRLPRINTEYCHYY